MPRPNNKEKIQLTDSYSDILYKLSEGNPGALSVLVSLSKDSPRIDPDDFLGGLGPLLSLDLHRIYGSNIWILYKNCCGLSILNMLGMLRCVQMGILSPVELWEYIDGRKSIDCQKYLDSLKVKLPNFGNNR